MSLQQFIVEAVPTSSVSFSGDSYNSSRGVGLGYVTANIDASQNVFDVSSGHTLADANMTPADYYEIQNQIVDGTDYSGAGLVTINPNNIYVTPQSYFTPATDDTGAIQRAVALASNGDTIHIEGGTALRPDVYSEANIAVTNAVTIQGESRSGVVVTPSVADVHDDSTFGGSPNNAFVIEDSGVTIENLTIDGGGNLGFRTGIVTDYSTGNYGDTIVDTVAVNNVYRRGVYIIADSEHITGNEILNSTFDNDGTTLPYEHGFAIMAGDADVLIAGNTITDCSIGIGSNYFISEETAPQLTIQANSISLPVSTAANGAIGMDLSGLADGSLIGGTGTVLVDGNPLPVANTIDMSGAADGVSTIGIVVQYAVASATVEGNSIATGALGTGIYLYYDVDSANPVVVENNQITGTGSLTGILASDDGELFGDVPYSGTTYATLTGNTISGFATGVAVESASANPVAVTIGGGGSNSISGATRGILVQGATPRPRSAAIPARSTAISSASTWKAARPSLPATTSTTILQTGSSLPTAEAAP